MRRPLFRKPPASPSQAVSDEQCDSRQAYQRQRQAQRVRESNEIRFGRFRALCFRSLDGDRHEGLGVSPSVYRALVIGVIGLMRTGQPQSSMSSLGASVNIRGRSLVTTMSSSILTPPNPGI